MSHRNALIAPVFLRCSYAICRKNDRAIPHKLCTALPQVLRMQWEQPAQHPPGHTPGARAHIFVLCHTPALASGVPVGSLQRARTAHWAVCTPASTGGFSFFLGINIIYRNFDKQRGAYKVILKNRFVFLKNGMHPVVEQIVLWHEIGHDVRHRKEAVAVGGFKEFNIFEMRENRMEYEANIFASQA